MKPSENSRWSWRGVLRIEELSGENGKNVPEKVLVTKYNHKWITNTGLYFNVRNPIIVKGKIKIRLCGLEPIGKIPCNDRIVDVVYVERGGKE